VTEILALFVGVFLGGFVMSLLSVNSYERGAKDERAKLWNALDANLYAAPRLPTPSEKDGLNLENGRRDAPDH